MIDPDHGLYWTACPFCKAPASSVSILRELLPTRAAITTSQARVFFAFCSSCHAQGPQASDPRDAASRWATATHKTPKPTAAYTVYHAYPAWWFSVGEHPRCHGPYYSRAEAERAAKLAASKINPAETWCTLCQKRHHRPPCGLG